MYNASYVTSHKIKLKLICFYPLKNAFSPSCITLTNTLICEGQPTCYIFVINKRDHIAEQRTMSQTSLKWPATIWRNTLLFMYLSTWRHTGGYLRSVLHRHYLYCIVFLQRGFYMGETGRFYRVTKYFEIVTVIAPKPWPWTNMLPNTRQPENAWSNFSANFRVVALNFTTLIRSG